MSKAFSQFTNQYGLSKTLRFELKPIGKTLENMRENLQYDKDMQTFLKDQNIEDAYQTLKPVLDKLHEDFITQSLEYGEAKQIDFSEYFEKYKKQEDDKGEKGLREKIGKTYEAGEKYFKEEYSSLDLKWKKGSSEAKGAVILECQDILEIIRKNYFDDEKIQNTLEKFKGFFTYLGGFNQNRANYYKTEGKASQIATRIIDENLPKFCDNAIQFDAIIKKKKDGTIEKTERSEEYKNAYKYLKNENKITQIKDAESGKMIEALEITEEIFDISYFSQCLSQKEIEEYNRKIGHYNSLINLYNQAKRAEENELPKNQKTFKDLPKFKTLYKQIGCGKKKALFFALTYDTKVEAVENKEKIAEPFSVEEVLELAKKAGEKYFKQGNEEGVVKTIEDFLADIEKRENYDGIYWSKKAINSLSSHYFASWQSIVQFIEQNAKDYKTVASFEQKREERVKINDAVEISKLFEIFEKVVIGENWWESFFRKAIWEDSTKLEIIKKANNPGKALLDLLFVDMREGMKNFLQDADSACNFPDYKTPEAKEKIKAWMDLAKNVIQMFKYFHVNESKTKGISLDPALSNAVKTLIFEAKLREQGNEKEIEVDWFRWYDALRNYLTKKPQDVAKENKLKLNFENGSLLGGWSDGQEKNKGAVILQKDGLYYVGILKKKNLFNTDEGKESEVYKNPLNNCGRLILANLKFQTLAGKGFLGEFKMAYGEMGKTDYQKSILCLQKIIKDRYVKKYPLLDHIANAQYNDKKTFDKDIQETLKECYVCEFKAINWEKVEEYTNTGEMYLFQISSKDLGEKAIGKKNLQTLYWDAVFKEDSSFQLNGGAEIFYRKQAIKEKKIKQGYEKKIWVIENKRFAEENGKFFFHCPIKLNYKAIGNSNPKYALPKVNININEKISNNNSIHFLGIDRGEKHLAYFSLVNQKGEIVDQGTLNLPFTDKDGNPRSVQAEKRTIGKDGKELIEIKDCYDYNDLLEARAGDRDYARKNWQTIGTIKELKEGYISQVVRLIADLSVKHSAFIVLEDLNTGFKRGRQKIEKSVYQKFELALAKKLNFLVDKTAQNGELGSVTRALQLTPPVQNYQDIENKKQVGIMLYTRANYTSQTDPATGWRKSIYLKAGSEENIKEQIVNSFSDIYFDGKDYVFEYAKQIVDKNTSESFHEKIWKLYSGKDGKSLERFRGVRGKEKNEWRIDKIDVVEMFDKIFEGFDKTKSLLSQIVDENLALTKINKKNTAWESLRFAIDLIQQIRNTGEKDDERNSDFLQSPVRNEKGEHFDSRIYWDKEQKGEKVEMPSSGDANGAFNIARKGFLMNEHIKANTDPRDLNLFISDDEWDLWLADKNKWQKMLPIFSSRKATEKTKKHK